MQNIFPLQAYSLFWRCLPPACCLFIDNIFCTLLNVSISIIGSLPLGLASSPRYHHSPIYLRFFSKFSKSLKDHSLPFLLTYPILFRLSAICFLEYPSAYCLNIIWAIGACVSSTTSFLSTHLYPYGGVEPVLVPFRALMAIPRIVFSFNSLP